MVLSRWIVVASFLAAGSGHAETVAGVPGDDTLYPDSPATFDGCEVTSESAIVTEDVVYPGPRTVYVKCSPSSLAVPLLADDTVYPQLPSSGRGDAWLASCGCGSRNG